MLGTSLRFDTSAHRPDISIIRAFDRKIVALLPLLSAIEDRLNVLRCLGSLDPKLSQALAGITSGLGWKAWTADAVPPSSKKHASARRPP